MNMVEDIFDRRSFLKLGALGAVACAIPGLWGCSDASSDATSGSSAPDSPSSSSSASHNALTQNTSVAGASSVNGSGTAVVYFSCTGNTKAVAEKIATATDGTLEEIIPADPYTADDLNYNSDCRANAEQQGNASAPQIASPVPNIANASVVYLGYPIWWGKAPRIILGFLEQADTAGKTIVPFCTSGSSSILGSLAELEDAAPNATFTGAERFSSGVSQEEIDTWVASI